MNRDLPCPAALAGVDLDAHRLRALSALTLHFGADLAAGPEAWQAKARACLELLAAYGIAPLWVFDPALPQPAPMERAEPAAPAPYDVDPQS